MSVEALQDYLRTLVENSHQRDTRYKGETSFSSLVDKFEVNGWEVEKIISQHGLMIDDKGTVRRGVKPPKYKPPTVYRSDKTFLSEHFSERARTTDSKGYFGDHQADED